MKSPSWDKLERPVTPLDVHRFLAWTHEGFTPLRFGAVVNSTWPGPSWYLHVQLPGIDRPKTIGSGRGCSIGGNPETETLIARLLWFVDGRRVVHP